MIVINVHVLLMICAYILLRKSFEYVYLYIIETKLSDDDFDYELLMNKKKTTFSGNFKPNIVKCI